MSIFLKNGFMASLNISPAAYPALEKIANLSDSDYSALLKAIGETEAALTPEKCAANLSKKVAGIKLSDLSSIVAGLLALYRGKDSGKDSSSLEFSEAVISAITTSPYASNFPKEKLSILKKRTEELFLVEGTLPITAKALEVMTQHEHVFLEAKILSDLRPIFDNTGEKAEAAVVIHNLQLRYRGDGEIKLFYFALDNDDLKKLKDIIERAERKTVALKSIAQSSKLAYLEV